jgi:hypothetical protein
MPEKNAHSIAEIRLSFENILSGLHPDLQRNFEYLCLLAEQGQQSLNRFISFRDTIVAAIEQAQSATEPSKTVSSPRPRKKREQTALTFSERSEQERSAIHDFILNQKGCSMDEICQAVDPKRERPAHAIRYQLTKLKQEGRIRTKGKASSTRYYPKGRQG